jgi:hypothetical protein
VIIVTCHTGIIRTETRQAIEEHWDGEWHTYEVNPKDQFYYGRILSSYWAAARDFWVVEPDIVIRPDVIDTVRTCGCDYGCYPYPWLTHIGPALGCTWFRTPILHRQPDAMDYVTGSRVGWRQLDVILMRHALARRGEQPHIHHPSVEHLNPRKQLQADADPTPMSSVPLR